MFCPKCGASLEDGAAFCTSCGEKLEQPVASSKKAAGKLPINPKMLIIAAVAIVAVVGLVIGLKSIKKKVDITKYVEFTYEGYDGYGTATYKFDSKEFKEDYGEKLKISKKGLTKYLESIGASKKETKAALKEIENGDVEKILGSFKPNGKLDSNSNLSNGDDVEFTFTEAAKEEIALLEATLHCTIVYDDIKDTVSGLKKVDKFDPFETMVITYQGTAPNGYMSYDYDYNAEGMSGVYFNFSKTNELSNGDKITVTCQTGDITYYIERYGMVPYPTEKEYTVEGLLSYVQSAKEVSDDALKKMQNQVTDIITANTANWADEIKVESLEYLGSYFLTPKSGTGNRMCLVYKVRAVSSSVDANGNAFNYGIEYYYPVSFYNIMLDGKDCQVDITRYDTYYNYFTKDTGIVKSNDWWSSNFSYSFYGYEKLDEVYSYVVTRNLESYNHEDAVTDKTIGTIGQY